MAKPRQRFRTKMMADVCGRPVPPREKQHVMCWIDPLPVVVSATVKVASTHKLASASMRPLIHFCIYDSISVCLYHPCIFASCIYPCAPLFIPAGLMSTLAAIVYPLIHSRSEVVAEYNDVYVFEANCGSLLRSIPEYRGLKVKVLRSALARRTAVDLRNDTWADVPILISERVLRNWIRRF